MTAENGGEAYFGPRLLIPEARRQGPRRAVGWVERANFPHVFNENQDTRTERFRNSSRTEGPRGKLGRIYR